MTDGHSDGRRRGVTRGYVGGLIAATVAVSLAMLIASWGIISYLTGLQPVTSQGVGVVSAEVIVALAILMLAWGLWRQAIVLLRGRKTPPLAHTLVLSVGAYLVWCLGGVAAGLSIAETWLSPYALVLAVAWALGSLGFWGVLARRVYTDRPVPKWPWERDDDRGPDWTDNDGWGTGR